MDRRLRELIEDGYPVTPQVMQGLSASRHGHIRRFWDCELEVEEVPPPMSEEALTTVFERIIQGVSAFGAADSAGATPTLESR